MLSCADSAIHTHTHTHTHTQREAPTNNAVRPVCCYGGSLPSVLPSFLPSLLPPRCLFRSAPVDPAGLIRSQPGPGRSANPGFRDAAAGRKHRRRTGMHRDGRRTAAWPLQQRESRDRLNTPPLPAPPPRLPPLLRGCT